MHRVPVKKIIEVASPEQNLREISLLEDGELQRGYRAAFTDRNVNCLLDGWVQPHTTTQNPLLSLHDHIRVSPSPLRKTANHTSPMKHRHSSSFSHEPTPPHPRYHIRKVQSHEWESESQPIHNLRPTKKDSLNSQRSDILIQV